MAHVPSSHKTKFDPSQNSNLNTLFEKVFRSYYTSNACFRLWAVKGIDLKSTKKFLCSMGYSLWYVKIDPSQNQDLSTSLERPSQQLLNALISFEIRHS